MRFQILPIFAFLSLALVASHAALPSAYWNSELPDTPMPMAIKELLRPDLMEDKRTNVYVGKGGVGVHTGYHGKRTDVGVGKGVGVHTGSPGKRTDVGVGKGGVGVHTGSPGKRTDVGVGKGGVGVHTGSPGKRTDVGVGKGGVGVHTGSPGKRTDVGVGKGGVGVHTGSPGKRTDVGVGKGGVGVHTGSPGKRTDVGVGKGGVGVHTGKPGKRTNVGVGKGGVSVSTGHKGKPVYVGVHPGPDPFNYMYAATETQIHADPNVALFFLEKDMLTGTQMKLHFTKTTNEATFLPRSVANSIPFSSNKFPEILNTFSVKPASEEAEVMKNTIKKCEAPGVKGEEKYCATSLESMIDFSTSKLGKSVLAISTEVEKKSPLQTYSIAGVVKKMTGKDSVVCHKQNYAYAVFYCHATHNTRAYIVPLVGADGTKAEAVVVCHMDTSAWNPKHLAFQVLKVEPGTVPVCHFLPEDHIVWVRK